MDIVTVVPQFAPRPCFELSTEEHADRIISGLAEVIDRRPMNEIREFIICHLQAAEMRGGEERAYIIARLRPHH
jgi:hypothetical protein